MERLSSKLQVYCDGCETFHDTADVREVLDIEEDAYGRDKVTFICALDNEKHATVEILR